MKSAALGEQFRKAAREDAIEVIDHAVEKTGDKAQELVEKSGETAKDVLSESKDAAESTSKAATDVIREAAKVPGQIYRDVTKPNTPAIEASESPGDASGMATPDSKRKSTAPVETSGTPADKADVTKVSPPKPRDGAAPPPGESSSASPKPTGNDKPRDENHAEPLDPISTLVKTGQELTKKVNEVAQKAFALNDEEEVRYPVASPHDTTTLRNSPRMVAW